MPKKKDPKAKGPAPEKPKKPAGHPPADAKGKPPTSKGKMGNC